MIFSACNIYTLGKLGVGNCACDSAPSIVGVSCYGFGVFVNDSDYVTLKILDEVVGNGIVDNTTDRILVIVKRNECIAVPNLAKNLSSIKRVGMENTIDLLAGSDAVCIVGVGIVIKGLELSAFFPSQSVTEVGGTVIVFLLYHF